MMWGSFHWKNLYINSLESLENGRILLCFPQSGGFSRLSSISKFSLSRFLGRGCDEALFSEKKGFSVKRGEAVQ